MNVYSVAVSVWVLFVILAVLNGLIREILLKNFLGDGVARSLSSLIMCGLVFAVSYGFVVQMPPMGPGTLWNVGWLWLGLSLLFEFGFGHFVLGESWGSLLADYNIFRGRLLILAWVSLVVAPRFWGWWLGG